MRRDGACHAGRDALAAASRGRRERVSKPASRSPRAACLACPRRLRRAYAPRSESRASVATRGALTARRQRRAARRDRPRKASAPSLHCLRKRSSRPSAMRRTRRARKRGRRLTRIGLLCLATPSDRRFGRRSCSKRLRRCAQGPSGRRPRRRRRPRPSPRRRRPAAAPATPCWRLSAPSLSRGRASCSLGNRFYEVAASRLLRKARLVQLCRRMQRPGDAAAPSRELQASRHRPSLARLPSRSGAEVRAATLHPAEDVKDDSVCALA